MSTYLTKTRALAAAVLLAIAVAFGLATAPQSQAYAEGGDSLVGAQGLQTQDGEATAFTYQGNVVNFISKDGAQFGMWTAMDGTTITHEGGKVKIIYATQNTTTYKNGFYFDADIKSQSWEGKTRFQYNDSSQLVIELDESCCGMAWPVVPLKADNTTTTSQYYLAIPTQANEAWGREAVDAAAAPLPNKGIPESQILKVVGYKATATADAKTEKTVNVAISATELPKCNHADQGEGYWIGFGVPFKAGYTYTWHGESVTPTEADFGAGSGKAGYVAFYTQAVDNQGFDALGETVIVKDGENVVATYKATFKDVTIEGTEAAEQAKWIEDYSGVVVAPLSAEGAPLEVENYKATVTSANAKTKAINVVISASELPKHINADNEEGYWVRIGLPFVKEDNKDPDVLLVNGVVKPATNNYSVDSKKYIALYASGDDNDDFKGKTLTVKVGRKGKSSNTYFATYNVSFDVSIEGTKIQAAADQKAAQDAVNIANEKAAAADEAAEAAKVAIAKAVESGNVEDAAAAVAAADKAVKAGDEAAKAAADAKVAAEAALVSAEKIQDPTEKAAAIEAAEAVKIKADSVVNKAAAFVKSAAAVVTKAAEAKKAAEEAAAAANAPKDNTMQVSAKAKTLKAKKLKKKKQTVSAITVTDAKGAVTFSKVKVNKKKFAKKFTVNKKTGKITVKKGVKKGTYKITVKVSAAGEGQFQPAEKNVVVKIKVK